MSLTIQQVNSAIMFGDFTNEQLNSIISAVKFARGNITKQNRRALTIGSQVKFTSTRTGLTEIGKVTKIMTKNVLVDTGATKWRVPASMLSFVSEV